MKILKCNIKKCNQCKHNINGIDPKTKLIRCMNKGFEFEKVKK